jgi:hypothetical protein
MNRERLFEKTKNQEGRAGVILKASRTGFVLATTSFISGYGGYPLRRSFRQLRRQQTLHVGPALRAECLRIVGEIWPDTSS